MGYLQGQDIWYRDLLDYLQSRSYPVVDPLWLNTNRFS